MKYPFSFFLLLLLCGAGLLPCTAQQYFNKRYTVNSAGIVFTSSIQKNNKYYTVSICNDSINYVGGGLFKIKNGIKFTVLDSVGEIISAKLYQREDKKRTGTLPAGLNPCNNLIELPDGTFLHAFTVMDTALALYNPIYNKFQAAIAQFDTLGNVLKYLEYELPYCAVSDATTQLMRDFKPDAYGNWLMLTSKICNNQLVFCLRKLDSSFNEVWVKDFFTSRLTHLPAHLLIEPDGYVMTGSIDSSKDKIHTNYYSSLILKCDTAGNKLWHWQNTFDTTRLQYTINDILRTADGGYVYCGSGEGTPAYLSGKWDWSDISVKGFVEKLDASRNSVWKRAIGTKHGNIYVTEQTVMKELANGDIMVAGSVGVFIDTNVKERGGWIRGSLTRLNGSDGSIIWQRHYKSGDGNDTMYLKFFDMRQTSDGGFVLAGEARNVVNRMLGPIQQGWLVKVDSNGCLGPDDPQCKPLNIPTIALGTVGYSVYPNPSNGAFIIKSVGATQAIATVYDVLGRVVYRSSLSFANKECSIHLNVLNGSYIMELQDEEGNVWREKVQVQ